MDEIIKCLKTIIFRFDMYKENEVKNINNKNNEFVIRRHCEQIGILIEKHGLQTADVWDYIGKTYDDDDSYDYVMDFQIRDLLRF